MLQGVGRDAERDRQRWGRDTVPRRLSGRSRLPDTGILTAARRRHHHLVEPAGAPVDFLAAAKIQRLVHANAHFAQPVAIAADRDRIGGEARIGGPECRLDANRFDRDIFAVS